MLHIIPVFVERECLALLIPVSAVQPTQIEVSDQKDRGQDVKGSYSSWRYSYQIKSFFASTVWYRAPGLKNPCPSHHLPPDPSTRTISILSHLLE